jgi:hypothetical protein
VAEVLSCEISSFPQTYLGLPLYPYKLRPGDFQPLVEKFDRYLAGWKARLLSTGGRLVLVNAVLSSLAVYHMSSILLPKMTIELLDARRRAFLRTGEEKCHGSKCLIAWDRVCQSKENGGLGICPIADQNHALLLKLVHKVLEQQNLQWINWFLGQHMGLIGTEDDGTYIAKLLRDELPRY